MGENIKNTYKNYSVITKCEFMDDDLFSLKLVDYYKRIVYVADANEEFKSKAKDFDSLMRKYIEDYRFSKKFQKSIDVKRFLSTDFSDYDSLIEYMIRFSNKYDNDKQEVVTNTKWI